MIPSVGFCIELNRLRQESRTGEPDRTIGEYRCYWDGKLVPSLMGQMVECRGPGDDSFAVGNMQDRRVKEGIYPLAVHNTAKFSTLNYSSSDKPSDKPRPALRLNKTQERDGILIHPAQGWKWSVGCLNPATGLVDSTSDINFKVSRKLVIAIIDFLKAKVEQAGGQQKLPTAVIWIKGEPS